MTLYLAPNSPERSRYLIDQGLRILAPALLEAIAELRDTGVEQARDYVLSLTRQQRSPDSDYPLDPLRLLNIITRDLEGPAKKKYTRRLLRDPEEIRDIRNDWAHHEHIDGDYAHQALYSMARVAQGWGRSGVQQELDELRGAALSHDAQSSQSAAAAPERHPAPHGSPTMGKLCGCGCGEQVSRKAQFRPGHDGRLRAQLARLLTDRPLTAPLPDWASRDEEHVMRELAARYSNHLQRQLESDIKAYRERL
ncbi:MAG: Swt1 family HEPN domain-containing protein [Kineosporiaceae bacterium]